MLNRKLLSFILLSLAIFDPASLSAQKYKPPPPPPPRPTGGGIGGGGGYNGGGYGGSSGSGRPSRPRAANDNYNFGSRGGANDNRRPGTSGGGRLGSSSSGSGMTIRRRPPAAGADAQPGRTGRSRTASVAGTSGASAGRARQGIPPANSQQVLAAKAALRTNRLNALRASIKARTAARKAQLAAAGGGGKQPPGGHANGAANDNEQRGLHPEGVKPEFSGSSTWKVGPASRPSERAKGGLSLWDHKGGEWRWAPEDRYHNPHWDYNPHDKPNSPWQNMSYKNLPPRKPDPQKK